MLNNACRGVEHSNDLVGISEKGKSEAHVTHGRCRKTTFSGSHSKGERTRRSINSICKNEFLAPKSAKQKRLQTQYRAPQIQKNDKGAGGEKARCLQGVIKTLGWGKNRGVVSKKE